MEGTADYVVSIGRAAAGSGQRPCVSNSVAPKLFRRAGMSHARSAPSKLTVPCRISAASTAIIDVQVTAHIGISASIGVSDGTTHSYTWSHATSPSTVQHQRSVSVKIQYRLQYREVRRSSASLHRAQQRTAIASHASPHINFAALLAAAASRVATHSNCLPRIAAHQLCCITRSSCTARIDAQQFSSDQHTCSVA
jgi:hypothetical protein